MNGRAVHVADDGTETDITEGVQALYDLVIGSMDWGSGFWTYEDALPAGRIARLFEFKQADEVERYLADRRYSEEQSQFLMANPAVCQYGTWEPPPHDHVFSSARRCMWPRCSATAPAPDSGS